MGDGIDVSSSPRINKCEPPQQRGSTCVSFAHCPLNDDDGLKKIFPQNLIWSVGARVFVRKYN